MPPRPAREAVTAAALRGDTAALLAASAYLPAREAFRYDRRRAAAFATALAGERERALTELGLGGGVRSLRLGLDTAIVELLTRGAVPALNAVRLALRDDLHSEPDVPLLLAECVRRDPDTTRAALAVALAGGTPVQRAHAAAAVLGAARFGPVEPALPALAVATVALAVVAFLRLPGLVGGEEAAPPRLQEPRPAVIAAQRPPPSPATPRTTRRRPADSGAIQIALRPSSARARSGAQDADRDTFPTHARNAPRPPAPPAPASPPAPAPVQTPQPAPAGAAAMVVTPPTPPGAESTRQLAAERPPTKAERKAERKAAKEETKATSVEQKAGKKAARNATTVTAAASSAAGADVAGDVVPPSAAASAEPSPTAESKPGKPEKPDKPERDDD